MQTPTSELPCWHFNLLLKQSSDGFGLNLTQAFPCSGSACLPCQVGAVLRVVLPVSGGQGQLDAIIDPVCVGWRREILVVCVFHSLLLAPLLCICQVAVS